MGALDLVDDFSSKLDMHADINSMGRTVENEVVNEMKVASRDADLEHVQEELRKQLLHRELPQRELEFLENGGDPLDFRLGLTSSVSVQPTSLTGQHQEQIVTSKTETDTSLIGTLAHSNEPSPQQRKKVCDANNVDNTLSFDGENKPADVENNSVNLSIIVSLELSSRVGGTYDGKESEESTLFRPYARKNLSKSNHDLSRSALTDVLPSGGNVHVPVLSRFGSRDSKGSLCDSNHIDRKISSSSVEKSAVLDPNKTHKVIDVSRSNFDYRCSSNVETLADLLKGSSDEGSLHVLTSIVQKVHFADADRSLSDESAKVIVGKADLLMNGCLHSENANKTDEVNAVVTESPCMHGESQDEAEKGVIKDANECDTSQIDLDGERSDLQNNFENKFEVIGVPEMTEMDKESQESIRTSTASSGARANNPLVSRIGSANENISVSDPTIEIEGSTNSETIVHETSLANSFSKSSMNAAEPETGDTKELQKVDEDAILAEALLIEAKRKGISQLLTRTPQSEKHPKSHWHYVLEEMAWLANDFMQERLWKISAASQLGHLAALASCKRFEEKMPTLKLIAVAQSHARAVLKFWRSVESSLHNEDRTTIIRDKSLLPLDQTEESEVVQGSKSEVKQHRLLNNHGIKEYAIRFLKHNATAFPDFGADAQLSPGLKCSLVTKEEGNLLNSNLTEETLFYKVPAGAMESYRNAIESHLLQFEVSGGGLQDTERSLYDATEEHMYSGEEDEHDTCYLPSAFEGSQASKTAQKKRKNLSNAYAGMYDVGAGLTFGRDHSDFYARHIPKKRIRAASHRRQSSDRTYSSSKEDTDSFQDDQIEYAMKMEKHLLLDVEGNLSKSKKNKYPKPLKQRWQHKTPLPDGQRDIRQKRINNQQLKCIGVGGMVGQPNAKRSKTLKQKLENSFESPGFNKGTVPLDVASQMKNMPHTSQIMRMIGVQNPSRKDKSSKGSSVKSGSGHLWSSFEDQALIVLVHDFGPNWNLVSDAMNSAVQFVYIFRKPDECMERHKILMDKTTDDGADSAEDSVSSQPYPSTLPGIPMGSARQLFQRLQGPMEEDTLKSHFEKIMFTRRKQHNRKIRNDYHDRKQVVPNHSSHVTALSEVSLNYLNEGYLTPLDLCDSPSSNLDSVTIGLRDMQSMRPCSGDNSPCQGTSRPVTGSNSPHAMGPLSASVRDGMCETSRPSPSKNTQQKSNIMSIRQLSPSACGTPSVTDRNTVHMVPDANSMGMMSGLNSQSPPTSRLGYGYQGTNLSPIPIVGGMSLSSVIGMQNHVKPRVNSSLGTSTSNFSDVCTAPNQESQRQTTAPELHIRATQGNNHGTTPSGETSSTFSCHNSTPVDSQHQMPPHQAHDLNHHPPIRGPSILQHQAYALLRKKQHLQQQLLIQQQSSALIPTTPISHSPMLPQITPLAPVLLPHSLVIPVSQPQPKHHLPPQVRPSSHPFQQSGRPGHPYNPQIAQPQQFAKFANGAVTGNISTSQNVADNSSHLNRISSSVGLSEDQLSSVHGGPAQPFRPQPPQSFGHTFQQKRFPGSVHPTNPGQQTPHNSDNGSKNENLPRSSTHRSSGFHSAKSGEAAGRNPRLISKSKSLPKKGNESLKNTEEGLQENHSGITDQQSKDLTDPDQPREQIKKDIPSSDHPATLPRVTGSTGHSYVTSPSRILLGTESELYDSVLQNFDLEMHTASKPTKRPSPVKPEPTVNKGLLQQTQLSNDMIPPQPKSSQQPDAHFTELKGALSTQPTIR